MKKTTYAIRSLIFVLSFLPLRLIAQETPYDQYHYIKWGADLLENDNYLSDVSALIRRSNFDVLFIALHDVDTSVTFDNPRLITAIQQVTDVLHAAGKKFAMDIDIRNECLAFQKMYPGKVTELVKFYEIELDKDGHGKIEAPPVNVLHWLKEKVSPVHRIVNAWSFTPNGKEQFKKGSLKKITGKTRLVKAAGDTTILQVDAGKTAAGSRALIAVTYQHILPDYFSPEFHSYFSGMFDKLDPIPLDGAYLDEWGLFSGIPQNFKYQVYPYSSNMVSLMYHTYGFNLDDELFYFEYGAEVNDPNQVRTINAYLETYRTRMGHIEDWFYHKTKEEYGEEAIVGQHPTWIVGKNIVNWEFTYNGMDWWEATRDYGFTDESTTLAIRLALAHKWKSNIWYNMHYGDRKADVRTFFKETWDNAAFGGRTFYLGYTSPRPHHTWLKDGDRIEKVSEMEKQIDKINNFQKASPDARIAILFGIEAAGNWKVQEPGHKEFHSATKAMTLSERLRALGYLSDIIPTSEFNNGSFQLNEKSFRYSDNDYDATIVLYPEYISKELMTALNACADPGLIVIGTISLYNDGQDASGNFKLLKSHTLHYYDTIPGDNELNDVLEKLSIKKTAYSNGCIYTDGSAIFTYKANDFHNYKHTGNKLTIDEMVNGHRVEFSGNDFLCIRLDGSGKVEEYAAGKVDLLKVDGKRVNFKK